MSAMFRFALLVSLLLFSLYAEDKGILIKDEMFHPLTDVDEIVDSHIPILYQNGILFSFQSDNAERVFMSGDFFDWLKVAMFKNKHNVFIIFVDNINFGKGLYKYRYMVDSFWVDDPKQTYFVSENVGFPITGFELEKGYEKIYLSPEGMGDDYFHFYLKDEGYTYVSWVGNQNNWDPYVNVLKKTNGIWMINLRINLNTTFYKFYVDGKEILDVMNKNITTDSLGNEINYISEDVIKMNQKTTSKQNQSLEGY